MILAPTLLQYRKKSEIAIDLKQQKVEGLISSRSQPKKTQKSKKSVKVATKNEQVISSQEIPQFIKLVSQSHRTYSNVEIVKSGGQDGQVQLVPCQETSIPPDTKYQVIQRTKFINERSQRHNQKTQRCFSQKKIKKQKQSNQMIVEGKAHQHTQLFKFSQTSSSPIKKQIKSSLQVHMMLPLENDNATDTKSSDNQESSKSRPESNFQQNSNFIEPQPNHLLASKCQQVTDRQAVSDFKTNIRVSKKFVQAGSKVGCGQVARSLDTNQNFSQLKLKTVEFQGQPLNSIRQTLTRAHSNQTMLLTSPKTTKSLRPHSAKNLQFQSNQHARMITSDLKSADLVMSGKQAIDLKQNLTLYNALRQQSVMQQGCDIRRPRLKIVPQTHKSISVQTFEFDMKSANSTPVLVNLPQKNLNNFEVRDQPTEHSHSISTQALQEKFSTQILQEAVPEYTRQLQRMKSERCTISNFGKSFQSCLNLNQDIQSCVDDLSETETPQENQPNQKPLPGPPLRSALQKTLQSRAGRNLAKPIFEKEKNSTIESDLQELIENSPEQVKMMAALSVRQNKNEVLCSFTKNNVRTSIKGQEYQILNGINNLQLLSDRDKEIIKVATKIVHKHRVCPSYSKNKQSEQRQGLMKSVYEAEQEASSKGLIKQFSMTNMVERASTLRDDQSKLSQKVAQSLKIRPQNQNHVHSASFLIGNSQSPQKSGLDLKFTDLLNPKNILITGKQLKKVTSNRICSARARVYNNASKIVQQQSLSGYSKKWANDQLQYLLTNYESKIIDDFVAKNHQSEVDPFKQLDLALTIPKAISPLTDSDGIQSADEDCLQPIINVTRRQVYQQKQNVFQPLNEDSRSNACSSVYDLENF